MSNRIQSVVQWVALHPGLQCNEVPPELHQTLKSAEDLGLVYWKGFLSGWIVTSKGKKILEP